MQHQSQGQTEIVNECLAVIDKVGSVDIQQLERYGLCLTLENAYCRVVISLFGGQVLSYINKFDNKERLWLSKLAIFDGKAPIRGGIPICWPWFSRHTTNADYPNHGYARTQMFRLLNAQETASSNKIHSTSVTLVPSQLEQYAYSNIDMSLVVTLSDRLCVEIVSTNKGCEAVLLTQALHSYFLVDDIHQVHLSGVNTPYDDKVNATKNNKPPDVYNFTKEVDRIHLFNHLLYTHKQTINICKTHAAPPQNSQHMVSQMIEQTGHDATVVWNPWVDTSAAMKDMQNNGYKTMLCIEAANTANAKKPLILGPLQTHKLSQTIF